MDPFPMLMLALLFTNLLPSALTPVVFSYSHKAVILMCLMYAYVLAKYVQ